MRALDGLARDSRARACSVHPVEAERAAEHQTGCREQRRSMIRAVSRHGARASASGAVSAIWPRAAVRLRTAAKAPTPSPVSTRIAPALSPRMTKGVAAPNREARVVVSVGRGGSLATISPLSSASSACPRMRSGSASRISAKRFRGRDLGARKKDSVDPTREFGDAQIDVAADARQSAFVLATEVRPRQAYKKNEE